MSVAMRVKSIITLCRPKQWVKNLFVMLPLFFSGNIFNFGMLAYAVVAFVSFCLVSSGIYCLNDYVDADADRQHPKKKFRPIASGEVGKVAAVTMMAVLFVGAVGILAVLPPMQFVYSATIICVYYLMNIAYCLRLKRIALVDVFVISFGFVLRVAIGGTATGIFVSHWIILMTFLLALFLALAKRRDDIIIFNTTGKKMRNNIDRYNLDFVNQSTTLVATVMLVCYIMYTVSPEVVERFGTNLIYITSIFVLGGILRYIQLAVVFANTGSPTRVLLHDRFVQACIVGWLLTFGVIIYF